MPIPEVVKQQARARPRSTGCCGASGCACQVEGPHGDFGVFCFGCRCVTFSDASRCDAVQDLVRPEEVIEHLLPLIPPRGAMAEAVARWLEERFAAGRLAYIPDPPDCDRWCSPAATLRAGGGDCDDLAILAGSLLLAAGVSTDVAVGHVCDFFFCYGHAWVEGWDERGWFLLEATSGALHRGERPEEYLAHLLLRPGLCRLAAC